MEFYYNEIRKVLNLYIKDDTNIKTIGYRSVTYHDSNAEDSVYHFFYCILENAGYEKEIEHQFENNMEEACKSLINKIHYFNSNIYKGLGIGSRRYFKEGNYV